MIDLTYQMTKRPQELKLNIEALAVEIETRLRDVGFFTNHNHQSGWRARDYISSVITSYVQREEMIAKAIAEHEA